MFYILDVKIIIIIWHNLCELRSFPFGTLHEKEAGPLFLFFDLLGLHWWQKGIILSDAFRTYSHFFFIVQILIGVGLLRLIFTSKFFSLSGSHDTAIVLSFSRWSWNYDTCFLEYHLRDINSLYFVPVTTLLRAAWLLALFPMSENLWNTIQVIKDECANLITTVLFMLWFTHLLL